jgi:hypothetical protein
VPDVIAHVHVTPVTAAGTVSVKVAAVTFEGPLLVTVTVYETAVPGTSLTEPSVFVTARSDCGVAVSVSVAELLPAFGSVTPAGAATVAVSTRLPVAEGLVVSVTV